MSNYKVVFDAVGKGARPWAVIRFPSENSAALSTWVVGRYATERKARIVMHSMQQHDQK